ncbi:MAG: alanine/glycine:cation symporter family protein [Porticoccaceae bacterium]|nr:alanine/glycine:cation symporter family protein [Porticoccaceae bacterium]MDG1312226.1 alanine/glycine:cation symporter family protein [Porticoccaceae bacterium]
MSIDAQLEAWVRPLAQGLSDMVFYPIHIFNQDFPLIVLWLAIAALWFTCYLGLVNFRGFRHAVGILTRPEPQGGKSGEISHFKALSTAISGTVGVGNIGGVAVAIAIGGPGAAFWLFMAGFLAMATKFVECTLGVKYRRINADGSVSGGPMYYLEHFFHARNYPKVGKFLGSFYALALVIGCLGIGNMFQSNQAYVQVLSITGGEDSLLYGRGWLFGLLLAATVALVIVGGIRSIASAASRIVPTMAALYIVSALIIIAMSAEYLIDAIVLICTSAFTWTSAQGGMVGAIIVGFQRALFSNEAGIGSASIAHSAVMTDEPVTEGLVSLLEPFIDTMVICTLTSLVIVTTAIPNGLLGEGRGLEGIALTSAAFAHHVSWAPYIIAVAALLFAFSTTIAWSYYGLKGWTYLFGEGAKTQMVFKMGFCAFVALGCMIQLSAVLDFSDAMIFLIAIPNTIGLYLYGPEIKRDLEAYLLKHSTK